MNAAAAHITSVLNGYQPLADIDIKDFWELAPETQQLPFITYAIKENSPATKDRSGDYDTQIYIWTQTMTEAGEISDLVKAAADTSGMRYQGGETGYSDSDAKEAFLLMNFNFKIRI